MPNEKRELKFTTSLEEKIFRAVTCRQFYTDFPFKNQEVKFQFYILLINVLPFSIDQTVFWHNGRHKKL